ncbi:aminotransferase class IV family protein [Streptomyces sp. NPDC059851]|uniref:aminotransferase class IV family protein n=1 Tax=Streptomyces sp. NPDC059851 TaxID=3346971 RepID=UPI0036527FD2
MGELNGVAVGVRELQALALVNYGHFTTMRVEDGRVKGLALHLERLRRDCRMLFGAELDGERVRALARRMAPARGAATVRVTVFDPGLDLGHPLAARDPQVLVTVREAGGAVPPPLRVRSTQYVRDVPEVKSVGLFAGLHHRRRAQLSGFDDALYVDAGQAVSEGATWNIGFVDGGRVVWPDAECLDGVTMQLLKRVHPYDGRGVRLADLAGFEAAFATNAAMGVRAVRAVDTVELPGSRGGGGAGAGGGTGFHAVIDALRDAYAAVPGDLL